MPFQFSPFANNQFLDSNGNLAVGYQLFTYLAGSTTKEATYKDVNGVTAQTNPIVLNSIARPASPIFIDNTKSYKFVLASPTDTDPPSSPIYTADNVSVKIPNGTTLTSAILQDALLKNSTVDADPVVALGIAPKQYVIRIPMFVM